MAVGRYYFIESQNSCEVAFVTREHYQGQGMASMLLQEMARIAKTRGLTSMQAVVMANNTPMLNVFEKGGFKRQPADEPGEVLLKLSLVDEKEASCQ